MPHILDGSSDIHDRQSGCLGDHDMDSIDYSDDLVASRLASRPRQGRSGPRKKTGCLTCRKRKVRCDEGKPTCRRCHHLQVHCVYQLPQGRHQASSVDTETEQDCFGEQLPQGTQLRHPRGLGSIGRLGQRPENPNVSLFGSHLQSPGMLVVGGAGDSVGGVGEGEEVTHFSGHRVLPLNPEGLEFQSIDPSVLFAEFTDGLEGLFSEASPSQGVPELIKDDHQPRPDTIQFPQNFDSAESTYGTRLHHHFMTLVAPPRFILSVDCDWNDMRDTILTMAETSACLSNAIYAFSDAHLSKTEGRESIYAPGYYDQASMEVEQSMRSEKIDSKRLKASFGAIFFLIYVEVSLPSPMSRSLPY
jgi:hypothetical protein